MTQQFFRGDLVRIADDLGPMMSHFESGCEAVVMGSYSDIYGGSDKMHDKKFSLYILPNRGEVSWYKEDQLTLIEANTGWRKLPQDHVLHRNERARGQR